MPVIIENKNLSMCLKCNGYKHVKDEGKLYKPNIDEKKDHDNKIQTCMVKKLLLTLEVVGNW
jgi:hypothetical protein